MACLSRSNTPIDEYYRKDGVRIAYDPYASGVSEKYGSPGKTDEEGFDPYHDSVGAGIYGGIVKRDDQGNVLIGQQYQNHNPRPGPVYAGGGYAPSSKALKDTKKLLAPLLDKYPDLANDITTGGASPLHMCGMSRENQHAVSTLIDYGADIEALDTYGMTPLHRMASNNLALGAKMLIAAGANPNNRGGISYTPMEVARQSKAVDVIKVLEAISAYVYPGINIDHINVSKAGFDPVNGKFYQQSHEHIPTSFETVCKNQQWDPSELWLQLNGSQRWYGHETNNSYIYFNLTDKKWWIDGPNGMGIYITSGPNNAPPAHGWCLIQENVQNKQLPFISTIRKI